MSVDTYTGKTTRASCDRQLLLAATPDGSLSGGGRGTRPRLSALYSALRYTLHWILISWSPSLPFTLLLR